MEDPVLPAVPHPVHGRHRVHRPGVHGVPVDVQGCGAHLAAAADLLLQLLHPLRDLLHPVPGGGAQHQAQPLHPLQHHAGHLAGHLRHARGSHHAVPPHVHHRVHHRRPTGNLHPDERPVRHRVLHVELPQGPVPGDSHHHRGCVRAGARPVGD